MNKQSRKNSEKRFLSKRVTVSSASIFHGRTQVKSKGGVIHVLFSESILKVYLMFIKNDC